MNAFIHLAADEHIRFFWRRFSKENTSRWIKPPAVSVATSNSNSQAAIFAVRVTCELKRAGTGDGCLTTDPQEQLRSNTDCGIWSMQAVMKVHLRSQCQYRLDSAGSWWLRFRPERKSCFCGIKSGSASGFLDDDANKIKKKKIKDWCVLLLWTRFDAAYFLSSV